MRQARNAASPNHPNAAGITYADEILQVPHKVLGKCIQGENQMKA